MKKFFTLFLLLALLSTCAVAADEPLPCQNPCMNYVDTDGDGVCDNACQSGCRFIDEDGDGVCDNAGQNGCRFIDEDGDGMCDNAGQADCMRSGRGMGCGRMMRCNRPFLRRGGCRRGW